MNLLESNCVFTCGIDEWELHSYGEVGMRSELIFVSWAKIKNIFLAHLNIIVPVVIIIIVVVVLLLIIIIMNNDNNHRGHFSNL